MEAKVYKEQVWVNTTDPTYLKTIISALLKAADFEVLNFMEYYFSPIGYTAIWLLGESHLAVHTFPEENKTYFDLTSCEETKYILFKKLMVKHLTIVK